jgi:excinuclease ABC subunit C
MDAKWIDQFNDFGPDPLLSHPSLSHLYPTLQRVDAISESPAIVKRELREFVVAHAPKHPGVYGMIDALGRLVYVGKSKLLRSRLLSYFLPGNSDEKAGRIIENARAIVWEHQPSELASLLREQSLIRRWQPRLNVVGMPQRQQSAFLCFGRGPAEQLYVTRQWDPDATLCNGPFYGAGHLHRAVEVLNRLFLLRDCSPKTPMHLTDQLSLFEIESRAGCLRAELGTCLAPCRIGISKSSYFYQEELAKRFLQGDPLDTISRLDDEMKRAASGMHFERAARLQADLKIIQWLSSRLQRLSAARKSLPAVHFEPAFESAAPTSSVPTANTPVQKKLRGLLYLIRNGGIEYAISIPKSDKEWRSLRCEIIAWLQSDHQLETKYCRSEDSLGLATAWFQKHPKIRKRLITLESIDQVPQAWDAWRSQWLLPANA